MYAAPEPQSEEKPGTALVVYNAEASIAQRGDATENLQPCTVLLYEGGGETEISCEEIGALIEDGTITDDTMVPPPLNGLQASLALASQSQPRQTLSSTQQ